MASLWNNARGSALVALLSTGRDAAKKAKGKT